MTGVLQQLISVIEKHFGITLAPDTVSVGRFITHLRYLFVRINEHEQLENQYSQIGQAIRDSDPEAFACAEKIAALIELRLSATLSEDEISYLTLHVSRITQSQRTTAPSTTSLATAPSSSRITQTVEVSAANALDSARKEYPMISRTATIGSAVGLHARPASLFTQAAAKYDYDITISLDDEEADAASILEVMTLGAKHGDVVTLSCADESATTALDELAAMLERDLDAE